MTNNIVVSICCITYTYNHAPYICECLDRFLMQKCNVKIQYVPNRDEYMEYTTSF